MSTKFTTSRPFIVMMYGYPGAGKTSFSRQLSDELGLVHLQEDKMRHELFGPNATDKAIRKVMNYMTRELLKAGVSVVYDAEVLRESERRAVRTLALDTKSASLLVWLQVDPETTFMRTMKRDRRKADDKYADEYTEEEYRQILAYMQNPNQEDYIVVSGKHTFHSQRSTVIKKLYDLGLINTETASNNVVKPELMNFVPKPIIEKRSGIIQRNISIR
jgi:predicted kinase